MSQRRDIIFFSDTWGGFPTSSMHLVRRLVPKYRVFWIGMISRMPNLSVTDLIKSVKIVSSMTFRNNSKRNTDTVANEDKANPIVSCAAIVPSFSKPCRKVNCVLLSRHFDFLKGKHAVKDPVLVTTWPTVADFFEKKRDCLRLYYCVDDWPNYPNHNFEHWSSMEKKLLDNVQGVVGTSQVLLNKSPAGLPSLYLPHGVDFHHFDSIDKAKSFDDLKSISRPIVGFFGLISEWVDLKLIAHLACNFPTATFVLIGRAEVSMGELLHLKNVVHFDQVPYKDLPSYSSCFDIGLIPFLKNKLTIAVNPLKLLEYYALGIPVLATRLDSIEAVGGPMTLASTHDEFRDGLRLLLQGDNSAKRIEGKQIASCNSWEVRAERLNEFIESL